MTWPSALAADVDRCGRNRAVRRGLFRVVVFATAGAALASWLLPPAPTPTDIAHAYVEARFDRDWEAAWNLLCRPTRSEYVDYAAFAEQSDRIFDWYFMPSDVDVSTGAVRGVRTPGGAVAAVAVSVTTPDGGLYMDWEIGGDLPVVVEDGSVRVCGETDVGLPEA